MPIIFLSVNPFPCQLRLRTTSSSLKVLSIARKRLWSKQKAENETNPQKWEKREKEINIYCRRHNIVVHISKCVVHIWCKVFRVQLLNAHESVRFVRILCIFLVLWPANMANRISCNSIISMCLAFFSFSCCYMHCSSIW